MREPDLRALIAEHGEYVQSLLKEHKVREADVPDVAQEVWLALSHAPIDLRWAARVRLLPALLASLCKICAEEYRQSAPSRQERLRPPASFDRMCSEAPDPLEALLEQQNNALFRESIDALEPDRRAVAKLYALTKGVCTMTEVATRLHIPTPTAYNRFRLAREDLEAMGRRNRAKQRGNHG